MPETGVTPTPRTKRTLARASELARDMGHDYLGTEHILIALLDDPAGIAGGLLHRLADATTIRAEVIRIIESDGYNSSSRTKGR